MVEDKVLKEAVGAYVVFDTAPSSILQDSIVIDEHRFRPASKRAYDFDLWVIYKRGPLNSVRRASGTFNEPINFCMPAHTNSKAQLAERDGTSWRILESMESEDASQVCVKLTQVSRLAFLIDQGPVKSGSTGSGAP